MAHKRRRGSKARTRRALRMDGFSFSHGIVVMAIVAGAGLWGYALFNIATRPL
jgi:hypothetical protein